MAQTRGPQEAASTLPARGTMVTGPPAPPRNLFLPRGSPLHAPLPPREGLGLPTELTAAAWPGVARPRAPCVSQEDLLESGQRSRDESGTRAHTFWKNRHDAVSRGQSPGKWELRREHVILSSAPCQAGLSLDYGCLVTGLQVLLGSVVEEVTSPPLVPGEVSMQPGSQT